MSLQETINENLRLSESYQQLQKEIVQVRRILLTYIIYVHIHLIWFDLSYWNQYEISYLQWTQQLEEERKVRENLQLQINELNNEITIWKAKIEQQKTKSEELNRKMKTIKEVQLTLNSLKDDFYEIVWFHLRFLLLDLSMERESGTKEERNRKQLGKDINNDR
jgi:predicted secreted protein